jgi:hypothetical protein
MMNTFKMASLILPALLAGQPVFADMVSFDFDDIQSQSKKGPKAPDIELYMESLYGGDLSVSPNTAAGSTATSPSQSLSPALGISNGYLKAGKGKGSGISFDFGDNPIHSFSVDWMLRKGGKSFTILADGEVINQTILSKSQKKSGASGHQDPYFFDTAIHKLEFIGLKKKSFAIDNLVINIPTGGDTDENENPNEQTEGSQDNNPGANNLPSAVFDNPPSGGDTSQAAAAVPEPSSLLMLLIGLCGAGGARKIARRRSS